MPSDPNTVRRLERFTMLEPRGPNNPTPDEETWRIVEGNQRERFASLEPTKPAVETNGIPCQPTLPAAEE